MIGRVTWIGSLLALSLLGACRSNSIGTADCTPGDRVFVSCGCEMVGSCESDPDPVLRVCDGTLDASECRYLNQLGENDDGPSCGRCPGVSVVCPESGRLLVVPRGLYPDEIVQCDWDTRSDGPAE